MLVGGLGHDHVVGGAVHRLAEGDNGVGDANLRAAHEIFLEILEANLKVKLAGAGDDVLASLFDRALDHRVRLGQSLQALDELREILGVLALNGDAHDGGHGELHRLDGVRLNVSCSSVRVAFLEMNASRPTMATVLPPERSR